MVFKVNVGGLLTHKDRVLVVRRASTDVFLPGLWEYPGGGVEAGESLHQALVRELQEECGLAVVPGVILGAFTYPGEDDEPTLEIVYAVTTERGVGELHRTDDPCPPIALSGEHDAYQWLTARDLPGLNCTPEIRALLQTALGR